MHRANRNHLFFAFLKITPLSASQGLITVIIFASAVISQLNRTCVAFILKTQLFKYQFSRGYGILKIPDADIRIRELCGSLIQPKILNPRLSPALHLWGLQHSPPFVLLRLPLVREG